MPHHSFKRRDTELEWEHHCQGEKLNLTVGLIERWQQAALLLPTHSDVIVIGYQCMLCTYLCEYICCTTSSSVVSFAWPKHTRKHHYLSTNTVCHFNYGFIL